MSSEVRSRPEIGQVLMQTAVAFAERSTCERAHVRAVIAVEGRIISTGYNGAPAGMPHCNHVRTHGVSGYDHSDLEPCPLGDPDCDGVERTTCPTAVHAEANAIAFAARHGVQLQGATVYTTHSPCVPCAQLIINAGIKEVNYLHDYRITDGRVLLSAVGIDTHQYQVIE
jgi:dCMP deaminase